MVVLLNTKIENKNNLQVPPVLERRTTEMVVFVPMNSRGKYKNLLWFQIIKSILLLEVFQETNELSWTPGSCIPDLLVGCVRG
jgi:hypothetical protein